MAQNIFNPKWLQKPLVDDFANNNPPSPDEILDAFGYGQPMQQFPPQQPPAEIYKAVLDQERMEKMVKEIEQERKMKAKRRPPPKPDPADEFDVVEEADKLWPKPQKIEPAPLPPANWKVPMDRLHQTPHEILAAPGYWYVATPYTNYKYGREVAHLHATEVLVALWAAGVKAFGPISHTHAAAMGNYAGARDWDHDLWMSIDQPFMDAAHGLICVGMDGWLESKGVLQERKYFRQARKPMWSMNPMVWAFTKSSPIPGNKDEEAYWNA